jgi:hypothetical protein
VQASTLILISAAILIVLGVAHVLLTYFSSAFHPRQAALVDALTTGHPVITSQTTLWRGLIGFHVSHSMGAIYLGLIYAFLALEAPELLLKSHFLLGLGAGALALYMILAKAYWFVLPLIGFCIAFACFVAAIIVA